MNLANDEAPSTANKQKCIYRDFVSLHFNDSIFGETQEEKSNNLMDAEMEEAVSLIKLNSKSMMDFIQM